MRLWGELLQSFEDVFLQESSGQLIAGFPTCLELLTII
jgi:hypothetical protein